METKRIMPGTIRITKGYLFGYHYGFKNVFGPGAGAWRPTKKMAIAAAKRKQNRWQTTELNFNNSEYIMD